MNKRKLATLVAASFAGLMLSSPSFATDANKAQSTSGGSTSVQSTASAKVDADAKAEYKAAVEKCDAQPTGQRAACVQDAEAAQTLAMEKSRDGTPASGAPESRILGPQSAK